MEGKKIVPKDQKANDDILNAAKKTAPKAGEPAPGALTDEATEKGKEKAAPKSEPPQSTTTEAAGNPANESAEQKAQTLTGNGEGSALPEASQANANTAKEAPATDTSFNAGYEQARRDMEMEKQHADQPNDEANELEKKRILAKYGPNPVMAKKGQIVAPFTRIAWDNLKTGTDGTKDGWMEMVEIPKEVQELERLKNTVKAL